MDDTVYLLEKKVDVETRVWTIVGTIIDLAAKGTYALNVDVLGTDHYMAFIVEPAGGRAELVSNENIEVRRHRLSAEQEVRLSALGWQPEHPVTRNWWMAWTGADRDVIADVVARTVSALHDVYGEKLDRRWQVEWLDIAGLDH